MPAVFPAMLVSLLRTGFAASVLTLVVSTVSSADTSFLDQKLELCAGCHGVDGVPINAETPIIGGQEYYYLYVQLKDYKAGRRENPIMSAMVQDLEKDDMKALAEHYSAMEWPSIASDVDTNLAATGNSALDAGQCSQCHSTYKGDSRIPRLAGQQVTYLENTMKDFKNKVRLNSAAKSSLMNSFDDEKLIGMAHHLADLR